MTSVFSSVLSGQSPFSPIVRFAPGGQVLPLVLSSPHSGRAYPDDFLAASCLTMRSLRQSEDCYVHDMAQSIIPPGAALLWATFPRAYLDVNRGPKELDPALFKEGLTSGKYIFSSQVEAGFGVIPRMVAPTVAIYSDRLPVTEIERRMMRCYHPYHAALSTLLQTAQTRSGYCILLDCHSMPLLAQENGESQNADFILGDCHGRSCHGALRTMARDVLESRGYRVTDNKPYAGGYITRFYGRPRQGIHVLQIEIARGLYMNETTYEPHEGIKNVTAALGAVCLGALSLSAAFLTPEITDSARNH